MTTRWKGIIHVTGEPDTGKTTLALTCGVSPDKMIFLDNDIKGQSVADALKESGSPFGIYRNIVRDFTATDKKSPMEFFKFVEGIVKEIPENKYEALVFDNWSRMEDGIRAYSLTIMDKISPLSYGQIAKMQTMTWPYTYNFYAEFLDKLLAKVPLIFLLTHIKEKWVNNRPSGILEAQGQKPIIQKTSMRLWLRHNPDSPAPIGLVLKRPSRMIFENGVLSPVCILPRKVKPCTWDKLNEYWDNPIGNRTPLETEMPNAYEFSILDGVLTDDQKDVIRIARLAAEHGDFGEQPEEEAPENRFDAETIEKVKELKNDGGLSIPAIAKEMNLTPKDVAEILS